MISKTYNNLFTLSLLAILNGLFLPATIADQQANCFDNSDFRYQNDMNRDCSWVARHEPRCSLTWEGQELLEHCPDACGRCHTDNDNDNGDDSCIDDPVFQFMNNNEKNCNWVGMNPEKRCSLKWRTIPLAQYCPQMCGGCPSGKNNNNDSSPSSPCEDAQDLQFRDNSNFGCEWVSRKIERRCDVYWLGKKLKEHCPVSCDACPSTAPSSAPSSSPSESLQFAPPLPPSVESPGCCSLDFKQCIDYCGSTKDSCVGCNHHDGVGWLENGPPQEQCEERWQGCENTPNSCCPGLTCREDFNDFLMCLPPLPPSTTSPPTYAPTYLVEDRWSN